MKRTPVTVFIIPLWWAAVAAGFAAYGKHNAADPAPFYSFSFMMVGALIVYFVWMFHSAREERLVNVRHLSNCVRRYRIAAATPDGYALADFKSYMEEARAATDPYNFGCYPVNDDNCSQVLLPYDSTEMYARVVSITSLYGKAELCLVVNPDGSRSIDLWDASDSLLLAVGNPKYKLSALTFANGRAYAQNFKVVPYGTRHEFAGRVPDNLVHDDIKCLLMLTHDAERSQMNIFIQVESGEVNAASPAS